MAEKAMVEYALEYARKGIPVIPLNGKVPLSEHGGYSATCDEAQIRSWWTTWPFTNIGIGTGDVSHLIAIDVDLKHGVDGQMSLWAWETSRGKLPETVTALTGAGGFHLYYRLRGKCPFKVRAGVLPGVDVRGNSGCATAPPSIHQETGLDYQWAEGKSPFEIDFAEATDSVIDLCLYKGKPVELKRKKPGVSFELPDYIGEGERNEKLFKYACRLRGDAVPDQDLREAVHAANQQRCARPLPAEEVEKLIQSCLDRYPPGDARKEPEYTDDDLEMQTLEEVEESPVEWLIPGYIPKDQITLLCGTGGTGKTSVWCSLEASLVKGEACFLEGTEALTDVREPVDVMFFSAEDSVQHVLKQKFRRLGLRNMKRIKFIDLGDDRFANVLFGSQYLEKLLEKHRPALCVFDPIQNFLPAKIKMADRNAMRQTMRELIRYGQKYHVTTLVVVHSNKVNGAFGRSRIADSADLWDIARSVLMVGETGDGTSYLSHEKCNYAPTRRTVIFENTAGVPTFKTYSDKKDRDFVRDILKEKNAQKTTDLISDCIEFIYAELADKKSVKVRELDDMLKAIGFSGYQIREAKKRIKQEGRCRWLREGFEGEYSIHV